MTLRDQRWQDRWSRMRTRGRLLYALQSAFVVAAIISLLGFAFVYFTNYQLDYTYVEFAVVLFFVLFIYKFVKHYFLDWPRNEKRFSENA